MTDPKYSIGTQVIYLRDNALQLMEVLGVKFHYGVGYEYLIHGSGADMWLREENLYDDIERLLTDLVDKKSTRISLLTGEYHNNSLAEAIATFKECIEIRRRLHESKDE